MNLINFIFKQLPLYYWENDTYKDSQDRGILQRLTLSMDTELQEETVNKLEQLINELDPETATQEFLNFLAYTVGNPPNIMESLTVFRNQVGQAINMYKYKGTKLGYKMLFNLLGYTVEVETIYPDLSIYDIGLKYDSGVLYDITRCQIHCIEYDLNYSEVPGRTTGPLNQARSNDLIEYIVTNFQPIDAQLRNLNFV